MNHPNNIAIFITLLYNTINTIQYNYTYNTILYYWFSPVQFTFCVLRFGFDLLTMHFNSSSELEKYRNEDEYLHAL